MRVNPLNCTGLSKIACHDISSVIKADRSVALKSLKRYL